jgi:hypothetical protein
MRVLGAPRFAQCTNKGVLVTRPSTAIRTLALVASLALAGTLATTGFGATTSARHVAQTPTVTTTLSASRTTVGGAGVHDSATISGLTGTTFTGDMVTYTVYASLSDCTAVTGGTAEGSVAVSGNGPLGSSNTFTPTSAGTYYWKASFNGADHTNSAVSSDCASEQLTVTAATTTPTVTTALSASSTTVGGAGVHDNATIAGLTGTTFTGDMVTYTVYSSLSDCTTGTGGTAEGSVAVSGNGPLGASNTFTPTAAGTYYWKASFNGADHTNNAASSDCSSEPLSVTTQTPTSGPTLTTVLSAATTSPGGAGVFDTATLSGLTGTTFTGDMVAYTVYPSLNDCTAGTNGTSEGTATVSGNGPVAQSSTFTPTTPGTYYWQASFNGADHVNAAVKSDCSAEPLTVTTHPGFNGHGHFICRPLFFGRHHGHHHRVFICFRIGHHSFASSGQGDDDNDNGGNGKAGFGRVSPVAPSSVTSSNSGPGGGDWMHHHHHH